MSVKIVLCFAVFATILDFTVAYVSLLSPKNKENFIQVSFVIFKFLRRKYE